MKYSQKYGKQGTLKTYCSDTATPYITRTQQTDRQRAAPFFPQERWPYNSQELAWYNPYFHNGQDLLCSATQPHWTWNWENSWEEPKLFSEKSIPDITNFDYPSNIGRCSCRKLPGNPIICRLLLGIWLHTQREDGANTSGLRSPLRNSRSHNGAIKKQKSKSSLTGWRHGLLWQVCCNGSN